MATKRRTPSDEETHPLVTLIDYQLAIRNEADGRLSQRQLDGLVSYRYAKPWASALGLAESKDLLKYLEDWRRREKEEAQGARERRENDRNRGAA